MAGAALILSIATATTAIAAGSPAALPANTSVAAGEPSGLSDADFAQFAADKILKRAALPAGVQYQHIDGSNHDSITVVVTTESPALARSAAVTTSVQSHLRAAAIELPVQIKVAAVSDELLDATAGKVFETITAWAGDLAPLVNRIGPDYENSVVVIRSNTDSADLRKRAAAARFGVPLRFEVGKPAVLRGRYDDTTPWTAGNASTNIASHAGRQPADCTQGYSWRRWSDGINYASTAGHCFLGNENTYAGNPNQRIGYVAGRWYASDGPTDFELIRPTVGSVDASVWVGGPMTTDARTVTGVDNENSATNVSKTACFSGANGGTNCGTIKAIHQRILIWDDKSQVSHYTQNLTCVQLRKPPVGGDSGGPVLSTYTDGSVFAWGQTVAGSGDPADPCGGIFTPVVAISAAVGATIVVGS
ncbi:hypothetical protein PWY87_00915 [Kribbella solani]|uniref:hypothetical protein n=1 Tax=Kribbella solani TaxID=236067 RepID=UPI0029AAC8A9|nr:hypothetical protein [Kribbella solani]MDX3000211.1 hypothetical protein [Kribbella solani]